MSKMLSGLIGTGTWLAMIISHVSQKEIPWVERLPAVVSSLVLGALGLSFVFFVLFFRETRSIEAQGGLIVRDMGIRIILLLVGVLLISAASYMLYLAGH